jgi:hypothetical protein
LPIKKKVALASLAVRTCSSRSVNGGRPVVEGQRHTLGVGAVHVIRTDVPVPHVGDPDHCRAATRTATNAIAEGHDQPLRRRSISTTCSIAPLDRPARSCNPRPPRELSGLAALGLHHHIPGGGMGYCREWEVPDERYIEDKDDLLARLARIEGQVRGLARMVERDTYCIDVLTQVSATTRALQSLPWSCSRTI